MTQAITATRDDNTDGFFSMFTSKPKAVDPTALVNTALAGFQQAADNLLAAQGMIAAQKQTHLDELAALSAKIDVCDTEHSRLDRISGRLTDFLS
ncbi:hypothetical protein phiK7A1_150 [Pseudomonas phage phiK7A1]|uniref:Uncharacterized protein n=1 Tax=Pseudomonas phage phiK7A1 TaxID=2759194 RepID=A0A7H0XFZ8_9CAUD|nr:hypothetical protein phiK7A1_150 [Pseudomonas phage phiK7A1]